MIRPVGLPLLLLGLLACARPPQVEPRHPPASLLSEDWKMPGLDRADARGFRPDCAALLPYKWQPPIARPKADHLVVPQFGHARIHLVVDLEAVIDETGRVCDARLLKRVHPTSRRFDEPAREALLKSRFRPATFGGVPVAVVYRFTFKVDI